MIISEEYAMIAKTMANLEDVLAEELIALGANNVEIGTRMVSFTGDKALMYKANIHCRTALRILKPIYSFKAENADEVYEAMKQFNWDEYLSPDKTFSIDAVIYSHIFRHSKFVAYRVKDAIADFFTEKTGKRPSVNVANPDLTFNIHISHNKCALSLDSSGESLHKRGYRIAQTEAPLNEVLAAGMILKSGWKGESLFIDPMCGSGTLLIEAAMIALGIPPGIHRQNFAFEKWVDFDSELFSEIYNDDSGSKEFNHRIIGSDISPKAVSIAEKNIKNAGLQKYIDLEVKPFQQYTEAPASKGLLMTNPPYGERIKVEELEALYAMIGERLKHVFTGYDAYVLSYKKECFDHVGLKPSKRFFLFNGALECEMREYQIFAGKRDDRSPEERAARKPRSTDSFKQRPHSNPNATDRGDRRDSFDRPREERGERKPRNSDSFKPRFSKSDGAGRGERRDSYDRPREERERKPRSSDSFKPRSFSKPDGAGKGERREPRFGRDNKFPRVSRRGPKEED